MRQSLMRMTVTLLALSLSASLPIPAPAQSAEPFYKGRTINLVSGFTPGGSYDFYSRLVARHMGRHIPGQPTIVVQLMPGAGGLTAANYLYKIAPRDGTVIGMLSQTVAIEEALVAPGVQYKSAEFNWIGRVSTSIEVSLTWHTSKIRTIADARTNEVMLASGGPGSALDSYPRVLAAASGLKFKMITGYKGSSDSLLAMEKGEVDGSGTTWNALKISRRDWIEGKKVNILVQYVRARSPDLPDVPAAVELGTTAEDRALLDFYMGGAELGRAIVSTQGVAEPRVRELRAAFDLAMNDPDLRADIDKSNAEFAPLAGADLQRLVGATLAVKPELAERVRAALQGAR